METTKLQLMILGRFTQDTATGLAQARQALAAGDRETLALRLHSLKGNAGNVGALTLMAAAGQVEAALKAGSIDVETGLADLERQVADLTAASAPWLTAPSVSTRFIEPAANGTAPPPLDARQLTTLQEALRRHSLDALDRYEELESSLVAAHGHDRVAPLKEAIANLRFEAALTQLQALSPPDSNA